jgi:ATP-dependent DNA helicase PIF1
MQLFGALEYIARKVRGNEHPFGGVLLVLCGDFFQLPPVSGQLAFLSNAWVGCDVQTVNLRTVHRQGGDARFVSLLNEVREG